jgi:hypothetical protein
MKRLDDSKAFLSYSAVIGQCYKLSGKASLSLSVEHGRKAGLLDEGYKMTPLGLLVGNVILTKNRI